jgi:hypothetical protein
VHVAHGVWVELLQVIVPRNKLTDSWNIQIHVAGVGWRLRIVKLHSEPD